MRTRTRVFIGSLCDALSASACSDGAEPPGSGFRGGGREGGSGGTGGASGAKCATTFRFKPEAGTSVTSAAIAGEWDSFDAKKAVKLDGPDSAGEFTASLE